MSACLKKEVLLAFADQEMTPGEMESAEKHVAACAACQQELHAIRSTSLKVNALLGSLVPDDAANAEPVAVSRIPYRGANAGMRWAAVASVGALAVALLVFMLIRRSQTVVSPEIVRTASVAPVAALAVETKEKIITAAAKSQSAAPKTHVKVRQFQALDEDEPIETGMIYRVSLPATNSPDATATQSAKRIPAEVIVDEFGKVRAIRFLQ